MAALTSLGFDTTVGNGELICTCAEVLQPLMKINAKSSDNNEKVVILIFGIISIPLVKAI